MRGVDDVGLDREVVADELGRVGGVGDDAAHLGGGEEHVLGALGVEEGARRAIVGEVELGMGAQQQVGAAGRAQAANDGAADQAAVAGDVAARGGNQVAASGVISSRSAVTADRSAGRFSWRTRQTSSLFRPA